MTPMPVRPSGRALRTGDTIRLEVVRVFPHDQATVFAFLTESAKLGRWYGTWAGDPATGSVQLSFVEAPAEPEEVRILVCEPPGRLTVGLPMGWKVDLSLVPTNSGTHLVLTQLLDAADTTPSGDIGAGWEYYLDRLGRALDGENPDGVDWADYHPGLVAHYTP
jgi:uncharacterized protein YndB with AHSA1/START domain